jgi:hypothetical protein
MSDDLVEQLREYGSCGMVFDAADRIEKLEAALRNMLAKCVWTKREKWCGSIDCHCQIARKALDAE